MVGLGGGEFLLSRPRPRLLDALLSRVNEPVPPWPNEKTATGRYSEIHCCNCSRGAAQTTRICLQTNRYSCHSWPLSRNPFPRRIRAGAIAERLEPRQENHGTRACGIALSLRFFFSRALAILAICLTFPCAKSGETKDQQAGSGRYMFVLCFHGLVGRRRAFAPIRTPLFRWVRSRPKKPGHERCRANRQTDLRPSAAIGRS